ncbi:guanylate cyclase domain-containing protein, partial [Haematococcus lacustris]
MVTAGLLVHDLEHAATMVRFGLAMQQAAAQVMMPNGAGPVQMRIGIHSGPVLSGVIGKIRKRFCLVGHTVNCASRMESGGIPGRIQVSSSTHALLQHCSEFQWESRGPIEVKGLGTMTPYLLVALDTKGVDILFPQDGITDARSAVRGQAATAAEELLTGQECRPLPRDSLS